MIGGGRILSGLLDGQRILFYDANWDDQEKVLRGASREGRLLAPCCGAPVVLRWGQRKARHLAHPPRVRCPYGQWAESESQEHIAGKILLYDWCKRKFGCRIRTLALEYPLRETLQRPDIYLELEDGVRFALEYQRSAITPAEWAARHERYMSLGIHDIWVLGENRLEAARPKVDQLARWSQREPRMHFLKLRAFESVTATQSPFELPWWRGDYQEELWAPQELDARVGREVRPWYTRSTFGRLRSVTFLDSHSGRLHIYRGLRELPGHTDVKMASALLQPSMSDNDLELETYGFVTSADRRRLVGFSERKRRLEKIGRAHV